MRIYPFLIFLHVLAILFGIHSGATRDMPPSLEDLLFSVTFGIVVVGACAADARNRRKPLLGMAPFLMWVVWPVAGPLYVIWSRGWRGILWAMQWTVTLVSCYVIPGACVLALRKAGH